MSTKIGQVILVFDGEENNINQYEGLLHAKKYLIKQAHNKEVFLEMIKEIIPDLIIINSKTTEGDSRKIASRLMETMPKTPVLILEPNVETTITSDNPFGPFFEDYPLNPRTFLAAVVKAMKNVLPLRLSLNGKEELTAYIGSHFLMLNESEFVFGSTVKYFAGDVIFLESDFFEKLGQRKVQFSILRDGDFIAKRQYKNVAILQGANSKFQQKLKSYYVRNRGNSKK